MIKLYQLISNSLSPKCCTISRKSQVIGLICGLFIGLNSSNVWAQQPCSTLYPEFPLIIDESNFTADRDEDTLYIPTLFHVYYGGLSWPANPIDVYEELKQCNERLLALNADLSDVAPAFQNAYRSAKIQLKLARQLPGGECTSGIIYHQYDPELGPTGAFGNSINSVQYLNIHVAPSNTSFAILPGTLTNQHNPEDCIVLVPPDLLYGENVLVHEVGHWLGLYHTFGPTNSTGTPCGDDFIADTPPTAGSGIDPCNLFLQDCQLGVIENVNNFMDYSNCRSMFTQGQVDRMRSVLLNPSMNRYSLQVAENLVQTGVVNPPDCARSASVYPVQYVNCDSTQVRFSFISNTAIPDSVHWLLEGSSSQFSNSPSPSVAYYSTGNYPVKLIQFFNSEIDTLITQVFVYLNSPTSSLPVINTFPFFEGFESGFTLPNTHMYTTGFPDFTWQLCSFTGYNSEHCLYVPEKNNATTDTVDFVLGTFDMRNLENPTISFKLASALPPLSAFHRFELRFQDDCNALIIGNLWAVLMLNEIFNGNTENNFIPNNSAQWYSAVYNFPGWTLSGNATLTLRLITSGSGNGIVPVPFYLDDFRLGDPEIITADAQLEPSYLLVFPNPSMQSIFVRNTGSYQQEFEIYNAQGATVLSGIVDDSGEILIDRLATGFYTIRIGTQVQRIVKM